MTRPKRLRYDKIKIRRKMEQSLSLSLVHCHLKDRKKVILYFFWMDLTLSRGPALRSSDASVLTACLAQPGGFSPATTPTTPRKRKNLKRGKTYLNICYPYLLISSCNLKKFNSCCSFSKLFKTSIVSSII